MKRKMKFSMKNEQRGVSVQRVCHKCGRPAAPGCAGFCKKHFPPKDYEEAMIR